MKISAQEEYGLRCLVQLANWGEKQSLTLPQIAEREGISAANAGKLMWLLNMCLRRKSEPVHLHNPYSEADENKAIQEG